MPSPPTRRWIFCVFAVGLMGLTLSRSASAQAPVLDKVVLLNEGMSTPFTLQCDILDYTGERISLRTPISDTTQHYPASAVRSVDTPQTPAHIKGQVLRLEGKLDEARKSLEQALVNEPRQWVRREILALMIEISLQQDDIPAAASRFVSLVRSDPTTRHYGLIPLLWHGDSLAEPLKLEALNWVKETGDGSEVMRLIGASCLLNDEAERRRMVGVLDDLARSSDLRIRTLATAQLWRPSLKAGQVSAVELERWQSRIETMPSYLRGGPYYILAAGRRQRQEFEQAAHAFLWIPLVYPQNASLAARAYVEAADCLLQVGQVNESSVLLREATVRPFGQTKFGKDAARRLNDGASDSKQHAKEGVDSISNERR